MLGRLRSGLLLLPFGLWRGLLHRLLVQHWHLLSEVVVDLVRAGVLGANLVLIDASEFFVLLAEVADELPRGLQGSEAEEARALLLGQLVDELWQLLPNVAAFGLRQLLLQEGWWGVNDFSHFQRV